jgi:hypothetical protein
MWNYRDLLLALSVAIAVAIAASALKEVGYGGDARVAGMIQARQTETVLESFEQGKVSVEVSAF